MIIQNLDACPYSDRNGTYGGLAGRKDGILFNGERWIVKYPKTTIGMTSVPISYTTSPLNEFVASHIYEFLGYPVHETLLGIRKGKLVVACKDFCDDNTRLLEIRTIKNYANEQLSELLDRKFAGTGDNHMVNLNEMLLHIQSNDILNKISGIEERFWDMSIIDLFLKNGDRNNGNWGILRNGKDPDVLAPIFDNGGSFLDKADDEKYRKAILPEYIQNASLNFRTVFGIETEQDNPESFKQLNAKDFIEYAMQYQAFRDAVKRNVPRIQENQNRIFAFINQIPEKAQGISVCTNAQRRYFIETMITRIEHLMTPTLQEVEEKEIALVQKHTVRHGKRL